MIFETEAILKLCVNFELGWNERSPVQQRQIKSKQVRDIHGLAQPVALLFGSKLLLLALTSSSLVLLTCSFPVFFTVFSIYHCCGADKIVWTYLRCHNVPVFTFRDVSTYPRLSAITWDVHIVQFPFQDPKTTQELLLVTILNSTQRKS